MFERVILLIDDNPKTESIYKVSYERYIKEIQEQNEKYAHYKFEFKFFPDMKSAKEFMLKNNLVDVLVVDYDLGTGDIFQNGAEFIKFVRENVNKQCRIIFYTMQEKHSIETSELIAMINSDVYKMIDKASNTKAISQIIFDAAIKCDPIVHSLENFFLKYKNILSVNSYTYESQEVTIDEIIAHIRMDDEMGRYFIDKILYTSILSNIKIGEQ
ncbi:MAG: hypothetical protein IJA34_00070 [Lachnospiraceae bacterium]|nr:hypothetical protein [Lachnospiraceae bacterium]